MEMILLTVIGICLALAGLAGLALPVLPGAPLLLAGLFCIAWAEDFIYVGTGTLVILAVLATLTYAVDLIAGVFGMRHFGASPRAMLGAALGAVAGLFFGFVGIVVGPFIGAGIGELTAGRDLRAAGQAGIGATIGLLIGVAAKLTLAFSMLGIFTLMRFM
ncbi:MAG TPA: DUF456 domain-containing protein [Gammaproteobacteria bacterium]|jgi:hypothetical protein|nr:DUF456 domain-containing protein [Gammaproteobacteria bacterium]